MIPMPNARKVETNKSPDQLVFNLRRMDNGQYHIKGKVSDKWWRALCQELQLPEEGEGHVDLTLELSLPRFRIYGELNMTLKRQCVRSLEAFNHETTTEIEEHLTLQQDTDDGGEIYHDKDVLDMGEYLRQQFIMAVEPHPIKGDENQRGGVVLSDGLDDKPGTGAENPFAVLKDRLKDT